MGRIGGVNVCVNSDMLNYFCNGMDDVFRVFVWVVIVII